MSKVVKSDVTESVGSDEVLEMSNADIMKELLSLKKEMAKKDKTINLLLKKEGMPPDNNDTDNEEIGDNARIKVMSLCPTGHELNLVTLNKGQKPYVFHSFGEVKNIPYRDVTQIMETSKHFLEQGKYIILNPKVVRIHGLEDIYAKILTKEKIEEILSGNNQSDMVNLFKSAPIEQQEFIVQMFVNKLVSGEKVDLNLLDRIDRIYCYDNNNEKVKSTISERASEITALLEIQKKQQAS